MLKKLIFRGTRGRALVNVFDLNLDISDVLNNSSFTFDKMDGYIIIFDDSAGIYNKIVKICRSFQCEVYETSLSTIAQDLRESRDQKLKIRELIA